MPCILKKLFLLTNVIKGHPVNLKSLFSISLFINLLDQKLNSLSFSNNSSDSDPIKI